MYVPLLWVKNPQCDVSLTRVFSPCCVLFLTLPSPPSPVVFAGKQKAPLSPPNGTWLDALYSDPQRRSAPGPLPQAVVARLEQARGAPSVES